MTFDRNDARDLVGTCFVDSGKTLKLKLTCYSIPGYVAFTKTYTFKASMSFAYNTGCHSPFYSGATWKTTIG
ncbi:hypothetical protein J7E68_10645 [Microbacterium sp. ISL-103]|uniref:hypothetical protein n=1 Tax=Microbacterium sp. ISL-103 TaxID=2819156 RepID=UPI001BE5C746|nr:hypothetical protein [Microbacterium sp. ISL-103]MBT2475019.1 hypothetical protein [Microbacterium sp. ISL-103]